MFHFGHVCRATLWNWNSQSPQYRWLIDCPTRQTSGPFRSRRFVNALSSSACLCSLSAELWRLKCWNYDDFDCICRREFSIFSIISVVYRCVAFIVVIVWSTQHNAYETMVVTFSMEYPTAWFSQPEAVMFAVSVCWWDIFGPAQAAPKLTFVHIHHHSILYGRRICGCLFSTQAFHTNHL